MITGKGKISASTGDNKTTSVIRVGVNTSTSNSPKLTIDEQVTVETETCYGVTVFGRDTKETLVVKGTISSTVSPAVSGNGTSDLCSTEITIASGAHLKTTDAPAIYHPQAGTLTISGEVDGGIELKSGSATVENTESDVKVSINEGAVIKANSQNLAHDANSNGTSTNGYAIACVENDAYKGNPSVTVNGGTITGTVAILSDNGTDTTSNKKASLTINGGTFSDLSALDYLASGADIDIKLNGNLTETERAYLNVEATVRLNLNGNTYTSGSDGRLLTVNAGNLTISNGYAVGRLDAYDSSVVTIASDATVTGMTVVWGGGTYGNGGCKTPTLNVYGTVQNTDAQAISTNGTDYSQPVINIYDGAVVKSENSTAMYIPNCGSVNIYGGTITGKNSAIGFKQGTLNISGGTLTATGEDSTPTEGYSNGINASGAAIQLESNSDYKIDSTTAGKMSVNISGGTIESKNGVALYEYIGKGDNTQLDSLSISGGTFISNKKENDSIVLAMLSEQYSAKTGALKFVRGGKFNANPSAYLASGYSYYINSDGKYVVYYPTYSDSSSTTDQVLGTTTETDPVTGTVTETTETSEGTTIKETTTDGTVTETIKDTEGNTTKITVTETDEAGEVAKTTETVYNEDKSFVTTTTTASGIEQEVKVASDNSVTEVNVEIPEEAVEEGAVTLPAAVTVTDKSQVKTAPVVTITAPAGTQVTIPVNQDSSTIVVVKVNADGTEEIVKIAPEAEGAVVAPVDEDGVATYKVIDNAKSFSDVENGEWYTETVAKAAAREIMNGIGDTGTFAPNESTTRAMMAQILFNVDNAISTGTTANFGDLVDGAWYTDAVSWAAGAGVVTGYGDGNFDPEGNVTREQAITMIWRYAGKPSANTSALSKFSDSANASDYAKEALAWAAEVGILQGNNGQILAGDSATRAEIATLALRFCTL